MIDTVFLDVGGVLILPRHDLVIGALAEAGHEVDDPDLLDHAHYHGSAALAEWPEAVEGTHRDMAIYEAFHGAYLSALGVHERLVDGARAALAEAFQRPDMWSRPAPDARPGLEAIARSGARVAIVSNADGHVESWLRELGLCQVGEGPGVEVDAVLDSHVVGVAKPDPRIFEMALDAVGGDPERTVHVGDIVGADVAGARAAAIRPLHFDPHELCPFADHEHVGSLQEVADLVRAARA